MKEQVMMVMILVLMVRSAPAVRADGKSRTAREAAEYAMQRFGRQAVREGTTVLTRNIERVAAQHGSEVIEAVRRVGPRALPLVEEAGAHGRQAARIMAQHGERGALVVARPRAMKLVAEHGESAAAIFTKHAGSVAEPVVERFGAPAIRALEAVGPQSGRRIAMLAADGDLARLGRTQEVLDVIAKYGDRATTFIWNNKGALAVGTTLTAFLASPETFLNTAQGLTTTVAENAVRPLADVPAAVVKDGIGEIARNTNWTLVLLAIIACVVGYAFVRRSAWKVEAAGHTEAGKQESAQAANALSAVGQEHVGRNGHD